MTVFSADSFGVLTLKFENARPISALEVGRLLESIGQEYRNRYKSDLIVIEAGEGSYKIKLAAAVSALGLAMMGVQHANDLFDFVSHLKGVSQSLSGQTPNSQASAESPGFKSVEAIVKIAASSQSSVDVDYRDPSGAQLSVKMSPPEVRRIQERVKDVKSAARPVKRSAVARTTETETLKSIVRRQAGMAQDRPGADALVQLVRAVEQMGQGQLLSDIVGDLDRQGDYASAAAIRAARKAPDDGRVTVF